jgi:hypothetical protein
MNPRCGRVHPLHHPRAEHPNHNSPSSGGMLARPDAGALREEDMLEYVAYALLGLVILGGLLYVTMSPEVEQPPTRPDPEQ